MIILVNYHRMNTRFVSIRDVEITRNVYYLIRESLLIKVSSLINFERETSSNINLQLLTSFIENRLFLLHKNFNLKLVF